jgi:hypothetical protein
MYQILPDAKIPEGSQQPDYSRFDTPVWPKAHTLSLQDSYPYATQDDLTRETTTLQDQHFPLRSSRDNTGRLAGTQGNEQYAHPEDTHGRTAQHERTDRLDELGTHVGEILAQRYLNDKDLSGGKEWSAEEKARVEELVKKVAADGKDQEEAIKELLDDPNVVLSVREIKQMVKDWKLQYPLVCSCWYLEPWLKDL